MLEPVSLYSIIKFENFKSDILYFLILKSFTALITTSRCRPMARACYICLEGVIVIRPTRGLCPFSPWIKRSGPRNLRINRFGKYMILTCANCRLNGATCGSRPV